MKKNENSVTLAIQRLRQFQQSLFDRKKSQQDLYEETEEIMRYMFDAEKEIETNYEEISARLTEAMNTGKF